MFKKDAVINLLFMPGLLFIAASGYFIHSYETAKTLILTLFVSGFVLFLVSKLSVIRTGKYITFGSGLMSRQYKTLYRIGYLLMGIGALFSLIFISALNR